MKYFSDIAALFTKKEKKLSILLFIMIIFMALFDIIGIASLMPFMAILTSPEVIFSNKYLFDIYTYFAFNTEQQFLLFIGVCVFFALIFSIFFRGMTQWFLLRFAYLRAFSMSTRLVEGYLFQTYSWFLGRHSADLGKNILGEVDQVVMGAVIPLMQAIAQIVVLIAIFIFLVAVDPILAIYVAFVLAITYSAIYLLLKNKLSTLGSSRVQANKERYQTLTEMFGGIKEVKVSGSESKFVEKFKPSAMKFALAQSGSQIFAEMPRYALEMIAFGGMLLIVLFIMSTSEGINSVIPILTAYALAAYRMMPAVQLLFRNLAILRFNGPALSKLAVEFRDLADSRGFKGDLHKIGFNKSIDLENIIYSYPGSPEPNIKDISFKIPFKSSVGIVGSTGSGKTTAIDILLGLLLPDSGCLKVDGVNINKSNSVNWRKNIGYVPQDIYLSDDTIESNIAFGASSQDIDSKAIINAAKIANLHDFVTNDLELGYKTVVGERGVRLSGGQKQRIGIARALYFSPSLLILDEATSALDNITENLVMEAIENLNNKITMVIIAHRLSTVQKCNSILVLEKGLIKDSGTYQELMQSSELFKKINKIEND